MPEHLHCSQEILLSQSVKMNLGGKNMRWGGGSKKTKEAHKPKRLQGGGKENNGKNSNKWEKSEKDCLVESI